MYTEYLSATPALSAPKNYEHVKSPSSLIDFPEIKNISCQLKNVSDALSGTSACAFYLHTIIDSTKDNIIYINKSRVDSNELFSTLARKAIQDICIRQIIFNYESFSPSDIFLPAPAMMKADWGTYAQLYSYSIEFKNVDEQTTKLESSASFTGIMTCSRYHIHLSADLYVNYKNYDENALANYLQTV